MNYYSHSGDFYAPRSNRMGALYNVFIVIIFLGLLAFGIGATYNFG